MLEGLFIALDIYSSPSHSSRKMIDISIDLDKSLTLRTKVIQCILLKLNIEG